MSLSAHPPEYIERCTELNHQFPDEPVGLSSSDFADVKALTGHPRKSVNGLSFTGNRFEHKGVVILELSDDNADDRIHRVLIVGQRARDSATITYELTNKNYPKTTAGFKLGTQSVGLDHHHPDVYWCYGLALKWCPYPKGHRKEGMNSHTPKNVVLRRRAEIKRLMTSLCDTDLDWEDFDWNAKRAVINSWESMLDAWKGGRMKMAGARSAQATEAATSTNGISNTPAANRSSAFEPELGASLANAINLDDDDEEQQETSRVEPRSGNFSGRNSVSTGTTQQVKYESSPEASEEQATHGTPSLPRSTPRANSIDIPTRAESDNLSERDSISANTTRRQPNSKRSYAKAFNEAVTPQRSMSRAMVPEAEPHGAFPRRTVMATPTAQSNSPGSPAFVRSREQSPSPGLAAMDFNEEEIKAQTKMIKAQKTLMKAQQDFIKSQRQMTVDQQKVDEATEELKQATEELEKIDSRRRQEQ